MKTGTIEYENRNNGDRKLQIIRFPFIETVKRSALPNYE